MADRNRRRPRRGAVLIVVMVCLAVATVLLVSIVKMAAVDRRATRTEAWRTQAAWLAESALERAASRLASDNTYAGETWTVTAEESTVAEPGLVEISIEPVPDRPDLRRVHVRADYPNHARHRARQSKQLIVQVSIPVEERP